MDEQTKLTIQYASLNTLFWMHMLKLDQLVDYL